MSFIRIALFSQNKLVDNVRRVNDAATINLMVTYTQNKTLLVIHWSLKKENPLNTQCPIYASGFFFKQVYSRSGPASLKISSSLSISFSLFIHSVEHQYIVT